MTRIWPISVLKPISIPGRTRSIYSAIWKNLRNELFIFVVVVVWPGKSEFMGWGISTKLVVSSNVSGNIKQTLWCENPTFTGPSLLSRQGGDSSSSLQWQHAMQEMKRGERRNEQEGPSHRLRCWPKAKRSTDWNRFSKWLYIAAPAGCPVSRPSRTAPRPLCAIFSIFPDDNQRKLLQ